MEEQFDIEKWRKEHPVDYPQMISFIMKATGQVQVEIFKALYNITRLYIPEILYKYFSLTEDEALNEAKFNTLAKKQIYMSDIRALNDIFDSKAYFFNPESLKKYDRGQQGGPGLFEEAHLLNKVSSFTANGINSMPMWAHYANNHQGYCVSYDIDKNKNFMLSSNMFQIQYTDKRIDITTILTKQLDGVICKIAECEKNGEFIVNWDDATIPYLFAFFSNIKHESWRYENEFRCSISDGKPYMTANPKAIYIGAKCLDSRKKKLIEIGHALQVPLFQMFYEPLSLEFNLKFKKYDL